MLNNLKFIELQYCGLRWGISDLSALDSALEFVLAEPVVESGLSLVPADAVEEGASAQVSVYGLTHEEVDHSLCAKCHLIFFYLLYT
jgi:hypothetical protein